MKMESIKSEDFLLGFLVPIFVVIGVSLLNIFDFLYIFFPPLLILAFLVALFWRKWELAGGMVSFVVFSYLLHWIIPVFWSWIMADNEIIRRLLK